MSGPFERFIGIDWSGAARISGQRVYVAEAHRRDAQVIVRSIVRAQDRAAVERYLRGERLTHARAWEGWPGPRPLDRRARRVVALDFAFGFPAEFRHPDGESEWEWGDLGRWAASLEADGSGPVRRAIVEREDLARQFRVGAGQTARMHLRATDRLAPGRPESVFHLIGPSQVGLGSITGIGMLHRLREVQELAVWPFDDPERIESASTVLVEVFPRMWLTAGIRKNELPERVRQLDQWRREGVAFSPSAEHGVASSGDALDAAAAAIGAARSWHRLPSPGAVPEEARRREGWIAGVPIPG